MAELTDGVYQYHVACTSKKCDSSDAMSIWKHDDGRHNAFCHSCGYKVYSVDPNTLEKIDTGYQAEEEINMEDVEVITNEFDSDSLKARKIKKQIAELYGVKVGYNEAGTQDAHFYPTHKEDKVVGYSKRETFQSWDNQVTKKPELLGKMKKFSTVGYAKVDVQLFGQEVYPAPNGGGRYKSRIFLTTGQEDALAGTAMIDHLGKKQESYPFVSVVGGDSGGIKNLKHNLSYISSFDEIYLCADNDDSGKKFEEEACKILPVGKVKIMSFNPTYGKDLSDLWNKEATNDRERGCELFWNAIWSSKDYSPAGIKSLSEGWEGYIHRGEDPLIPFPDSFGDLNAKTCGGYGADGEIINIAAPSSVGKSSFIKEMIYTALKDTDRNIGVISLEETLPEFLEGMLSIHMSTQLNEIPFDERDRVLEREKFDELLALNNEGGSDRIHFLDDPGACRDEDDLWEKVDFLIKGLDCSLMVLDPVTLALSLGIDEDEYNATLVKKVKRHKLAWVNVHHVRKSGSGGTANSEGADLAEEDIKGSGSHFQTGMINIILTRNKVHENDIVRNTTKIKMPKCRRHGKNTGIAGYTFYDGKTGRLHLGSDPSDILEAEANSQDDEEDWTNN
tara:strand:- start:16413 stop:18266 length:1854 start_codon:yes stop_codon:yes gene_type:complete